MNMTRHSSSNQHGFAPLKARASTVRRPRGPRVRQSKGCHHPTKRQPATVGAEEWGEMRLSGPVVPILGPSLRGSE
jgi:hypothetical protein